MKKDIMVSICCMTYNHENYIRQCLDGFLMQQTSFSIEIIVHDDASTDNTPNILREYEKKYPELFHVIYQNENQYSKKEVSIFLDYMFPLMKGKYIAFCEGDDYWINPYKLQHQIDFLENHPEYSICCHRSKRYFQHEKIYKKYNIPKEIKNKYFYFNLKEWVKLGHFFQTSSVIIRKNCIDKEFLKSFEDWKDSHLYYSVLEKGNGFFIKDIMSIRRMHDKGVWCSLSLKEKQLSGITTSYSIYQRRKNSITRKWVVSYLVGLIALYTYKDKSIHPIKALKAFPMIVNYCGYRGIIDAIEYTYWKIINRIL